MLWSRPACKMRFACGQMQDAARVSMARKRVSARECILFWTNAGLCVLPGVESPGCGIAPDAASPRRGLLRAANLPRGGAFLNDFSVVALRMRLAIPSDIGQIVYIKLIIWEELE